MAGDGARVYPIGSSSKAGVWFLDAVILAGSFALLGDRASKSDTLTRAILILAGLAATFFGCIAALWPLAAATALYPDRAERRGLFGARAMLKANIASVQTVRDRSGSVIRLLLRSKQKGERNLSVYYFQADHEFDAWFQGLPNAQEIQRAELEANPALGATPEARKARLRVLTYLTGGLFAVAGFFAAWTLCYPQPYTPLIWIDTLLPLFGLAIVAWSGGAVAIAATSKAPQIMGCLLAASLALAVRTLDTPIGDPQYGWIPAVILGALLAFWTWRTTPELSGKAWGTVIAAILGTLYAAGAIFDFDRILDHAPPRLQPAVINERHINRGRPTEYVLHVQPNGSATAAAIEYRVSPRLYSLTQVGEPVMIASHPGAFGIPWYGLGPLHPPPPISVGARDRPAGETRMRCIVTAKGALRDCTRFRVLGELGGLGVSKYPAPLRGTDPRPG